VIPVPGYLVPPVSGEGDDNIKHHNYEDSVITL